MSEGMRDRLRRLRRDASGEDAATGQHERGAAPSTGSPDSARLVAPSLDPPANLALAEGPAGIFAARSHCHNESDLHGCWALSEIDAVDTSAFHTLTGDAALDGLDLRRAVYLDTETTGLSGGAGTWVYMVGLGRFVGDRFEVWQGFLRGPEDERALLAEVAARIAAADSVVSFFGKSFDRHRLEDKMRVVGVAPPFEGRPHLDLGHPLKRLTKGAYPDGRLATLEHELCGLVRQDDLPGAMAPAAWFDHLAGRPHRLEGVFRHNKDDVLSLVTLAAYLGRVNQESRANGEVLPGPADFRARAMARSLESLGDREAAVDWWSRAFERAPTRDVELARAECLRRSGRADAAHAAFVALAAAPDDRTTAPALLAHAKLLEHDCVDAAGALEASRRAALLVTRFHCGTEAKRLGDDLLKRIERLARRTGLHQDD